MECPNGKMSRHKMKKLFEKAFPGGKNDETGSRLEGMKASSLFFSSSGNATSITCHLFRIFDLDRNDYLDFKEFLLAIDVAMRETGDKTTTKTNNFKTVL